ncbi:hypothetical protein A1O3_03105 [Capronia epimyces CBS 606.96]|uniref:Exosome complex protein n=1 Tax=Capronia epimyces CBS 606.96 TaxID=1182542 RepID=W9YB05_9EURO|nr:uncharacterized protein A1O3_03105 [Capronia epimyces CBS 606.96]EXJ90037.1 hypothetical protein A1O3_03105 [Capronia epimyces CBS 606.96]
MDTNAVISLVDHLEDSIDDLEEALQPLLEGALAATAKKLPVLDRAKLNVLLVYSIESLLFSYLKLHGVQAKDHAVFRELTRVKQYFEKIKEAETVPDARPTLTLDKEAAGRFIKHALAGNEKFDLERAERAARERVLANQKLKSLEASMKAKAIAQETHESVDVNTALQQAAQLASVRPSDSAGDSSSSSESEPNDASALVKPEQTPSSTSTPVTSSQKKAKAKSKPTKGSTDPSKVAVSQSPAQQGKKRKAKPTQEEQEAKKQIKQEKKAKKAQNKANDKAKHKVKPEAIGD